MLDCLSEFGKLQVLIPTASLFLLLGHEFVAASEVLLDEGVMGLGDAFGFLPFHVVCCLRCHSGRQRE